MEETVGTFALPTRRRTEQGGERKDLWEGLTRTRVQINQAYLCFNSADDPDLIESYVYEINALQARYNYLLRRAKELEAAR
jgi:hypothetical protein